MNRKLVKRILSIISFTLLAVGAVFLCINIWGTDENWRTRTLVVSACTFLACSLNLINFNIKNDK